MEGHYRIQRQGKPNVLEWQQQSPREPGSNELLIRHTAIGLNYIDAVSYTHLTLPTIYSV